MYRRPLLLCLSTNPQLLLLRSRVLSTQYDVVSIRSVDEMEALSSDSAFDLLVLCHTLSLSQFEFAISLAQRRWPDIKIIAVSTPWSPRSPRIAEQVSSLAGAPVLLHSVSDLLAGRT